MKPSSMLFLIGLFTMNSCSFVGDKIDAERSYLRAAALYNDKEHSKKCSAVFDQLRTKLKVGMTSAKAARALGDSKWLEAAHTYEITFLAGWIPVDFVPERAFAMHLYPNADYWSNYVVYFSLSCPEGDRAPFAIEDFLRGKIESDEFNIHQFALCYPGRATDDMGRSRSGFSIVR